MRACEGKQICNFLPTSGLALAAIYLGCSTTAYLTILHLAYLLTPRCLETQEITLTTGTVGKREFFLKSEPLAMLPLHAHDIIVVRHHLSRY